MLYFAPVNHLVHHGPNGSEWYKNLHRDFEMVHDLEQEFSLMYYYSVILYKWNTIHGHSPIGITDWM